MATFFLPEIILSLAILVFITYGVIIKGSQLQLAYQVNYLSLITLLILLGVIVYSTQYGQTSMWIHDELTQFIQVMVIIGAGASIILSFEFIKKEKIYAFEYAILILLAVLGLFFLTAANDLLGMYIAIELQSLSLYILAAFKRSSEFSTEAGLKYFVLGAFSSGLLLFGASMIYGFTGLSNFGDLMAFLTLPLESIQYSNTIGMGMIFIVAALFFKTAAVPFHMWNPDVYQGAPTPVTAFFAITPKIAIIVVILRLYVNTFFLTEGFIKDLFVIVSIASMIVGAIGALYQINLKRVLAYSAIGHIGYMLIGLTTDSPYAIQGVLTYSVLYMITTIGVFAIILVLFEKNRGIQYVSHLRGLGREKPALALALSLLLFSLAGIPPLAGFYGKLYIFLAAINNQAYLLSIIGVLTSVIGALYYIRIIKMMFFYDNSIAFEFDSIKHVGITTTIGISTLMVTFFFLYPTPLLEFTLKLALCLLH